MLYILDGNTISITDKESYNMYQEKDPQTQEYFSSPEEALAWGESQMRSIFSLPTEQFAKFELETRNSATRALVDEMAINVKFKLSLIESTGFLNEDVDLVVYHDESKTATDITFSFVDGLASATFTPRRTGTYIVLANGMFSLDGETRIVFDSAQNYSISCK